MQATTTVVSKTPYAHLRQDASTYMLSCGHGFIGVSWLAYVGDPRVCLMCTEPTPAPAPHDHGTREAAQRADEAERTECCCMVGGCCEDHYCRDCPRTGGVDHEAHAYRGWAAPTLAARIALALDGRLPAMAGGSLDADATICRCACPSTETLRAAAVAVLARLDAECWGVVHGAGRGEVERLRAALAATAPERSTLAP